MTNILFFETHKKVKKKKKRSEKRKEMPYRRDEKTYNKTILI